MRIRQQGAQALPCDLSNKRDLLKALSLAHRVLWMAAPDTSTAVDNTLKRLALYAAARNQAWHKQRLHLTYISTTGVYGNAQGQWIDERSPVNPQSDRARRRVHAEQQVRLASLLGHSGHILRAPGIYGNTRLPLDRIRAGTPAIVNAEDSWSNHIHELDLGRLSVWCNFKGGVWRVVNACDGEPCKMGDYFDAVADAYQLQRPPRLSRNAVKEQVSPMMWSFMAESRRIRSVEQAKLGFQLKYPSVDHFLSKHAA
ncbi:SDR family NAD(P)-dependent oxidoreductase [Limnobacter humi]|uniref:SDR family NAD(P)-dependent oxidoreductase n=1 Tax=Limnobacter humi TaxID=1778671 RepID=A0ABT1WI09_9BURK|nr:NAD-dependent epimerase/dehydratase family protein [Limnobacter humi]MCQ8896347.1 SDR family NAD(P)-dependent oxidoreductase [Limnobacter humi]